ncbi:kinase-like domain-containing protein [Calycina marina]|uniref:mitogen-activated protein kinase kinase n=1 Tax=Calycina marina TaxID=1763456 RepID=A0A9P7YZW5_9HELO|nr:kinase-like domain-containing protein [Calycina marina]
MASPPSNSNIPDAPKASVDAKYFAKPDEPQTAAPEPTPTGETSNTPRLLALRSASDPPNAMSSSSTPLGMLNSARRPTNHSNVSSRNMPQSMEQKMKAFHLSRRGTPPTRPHPETSLSTASAGSSSPVAMTGPVPGLPGGLSLPGGMRPVAQGVASAPTLPRAGGGLSARRGMKLPGGLPPSTPVASQDGPVSSKEPEGNAFSQYSKFVDTKTGTLNFAGKAKIHGNGIDFSSGSNFNISLNEVDTLEELGKGNYGTVYKVRHSRPRIRQVGMGLAGNKLSSPDAAEEYEPNTKGTSGVVMAMKEIRLELDEAKFAAIIMELDILHRCLSPYIIDFYGAFFQEGAVYICIEFMDGGSIDKIYGDGIPENVLRKITYATTQGLKTLKDDHNIIHRDVKPTNILVNTRGQVKICDFGVSGNLVASIAKTNIGCQSYMAPERISGGGISQAGAGGGTYSVQSDIWSLGLSIIECAMGRYPYPPETYNNIFSQLSAIVNGDSPDLPEEGFSPLARDFVHGCLNKIPKLRPTYSMLLQHGWLAPLSKPAAITEEDEDESGEGLTIDTHGTEDKEVAEWCKNALERKKNGLMKDSLKPALHAVPLNTTVQ